ncbi:MAG: SigB/SigF/SigG family RNA polymerase sigma factor [Ruthenibacterium sp.]
MYHQKVEICGINTAKLPVLHESEKTELLKRAQAGDDDARQQMVYGNLRLVLSVVQRFAGRGECMDDLFQVGCIGLMKAIDNFNLSLGLRFSTYGQPMIVGEIRRFLRDNNTLRVSRSVRDTAYKAMQAREQLQKALGRDPTPKEISKEINLPQAVVTLALESVSEPISLYEPVYSDGNGDTLCLMDQVGEAGGEESWISTMQLRDTVRALTSRERKIMTLRYLAGKTQVEVAGEIGISQAQVSRLEKSALLRIKEQL